MLYSSNSDTNHLISQHDGVRCWELDIIRVLLWTTHHLSAPSILAADIAPHQLFYPQFCCISIGLEDVMHSPFRGFPWHRLQVAEEASAVGAVGGVTFQGWA